MPTNSFLGGGGEMGARMREFDWARTPLGPPSAWPQSLRSALSMLLSSGAPVILFWGPELVCFYNDACIPVLGAKHPDMLGRPGRGAWSEGCRRQDEFIATLSHELRNPLAPLLNAVQLLRMASRDAETLRRTQEIMERQVSHLVRLVDDLLEISRVTRGDFHLRRETVDMAAVVRHAVETSGPLIESAEHHLLVELPGEPLRVEGDAVRLAQILANLLNNAARYTPAGGDIRVRAWREDGHAVVAVRDNGTGFAPASLPRMFEMFGRDARSTGLGVGLALARRLAEMHGGTVHGASEGPGKGAQFTVRVPLAPDGAAAARVRPADGARRSGRPRRGSRR